MKKRILMIDDEEGFVEAVRMILEANGYELISANDGESGLKKALREVPDLILLDLVMPKMNGILALSKLRSDLKTVNIPVIILTAKTENEYAMDAENLGANDYLIKPAGMQEILDMVRRYA